MNTDIFQLLTKYEYSYMSIIDNHRSSHYKLLIVILDFYLKDKSELSLTLLSTTHCLCVCRLANDIQNDNVTRIYIRNKVYN